MAKFQDVLAPNITIRESADDGSDFSNPSADYRVLFLGEDGELHLKDSSGTVTDMPGAGGGTLATDTLWDAAGDLVVGSGSNTAARLAIGATNGMVLQRSGGAVAWGMRGIHAMGHVKLTGGSITCNQTNWGELAAETGGPGTGLLDVVLSNVATGDIVEVSMSLLSSSAATYLYLDVATIVAAAAVNYFGSVTGAATGDGVQAWTAVTGREESKGGSVMYTLQAGDISGGSVTLRPWMRTSSATNRTLFGSAANPFHFSAKAYRA
jgi:hypothetical protein